MRSSLTLLVLVGVACATPLPAPRRAVVAIAPERSEPQARPRAEQPMLTQFRYPQATLSEIAWLRERFKEELAGVQFGSLINELRAWVTPGQGTEVFTMQTGVCEPGELYLGEDRADPDERRAILEAQKKDPGNLDAFGLVLLFGLSTEERDGERYRSYSSARVAQWINYGSGGTSERWVDDQWVAESGWGIGDGGTESGVLSKVDAGAVYFDGVLLSAQAACTGETKVTCSNGSARYCPGCSEVMLTVLEQPTFGGLGMLQLGRGSTGPPLCNDPCPEVEANPDQRRANALLDQVELWRPGSPTLTTIFRARERCERELATVQAATEP